MAASVSKLAFLLLLVAPYALAVEGTAVLTVEQDYFFDTGELNDWQYNTSLVGSFRLHDDPFPDNSWVFGLAGRVDQRDSERTHLSIDEAYWQRWFQNGFSGRAGYIETFWGVAEASNPVNILNQSRMNDGLDGEVKTTQPMINLTHDSGVSIINLYLLTDFQDRQFAGKDGRPSLPLVIDSDKARHAEEPGFEQWDVAIRGQWLLGSFEMALSYFHGLNREPDFDLRISNAEAQQLATTGELPEGSNVALVPRYDQLNQVGFEATYFVGDTQWKGEVAYRDLPDSQYWRGNVGFEHGIYSLVDTRIDATLYVEYLFDTQDSVIEPLFDNDVFVGARLDLNDVNSSFIELGWVVDADDDDSLIDIEAETRILENVTLGLSGQAYLSDGPDYTTDSLAAALIANNTIDQPLALYQRESYVTLSVSYYW